MIKANELRIGNWIWEGFETPVQVTEIDNVIVHWATGFMTLVGAKPIPLTPEVLEKCDGVRIKPGIEWWIEYEPDVFLSFDRNMILTHAYDTVEYVKHEYPHIKYLHQLQNLYFALTGTELTYKP